MGNDTKSAHLHSPRSFSGFGHHRNADIKMGRRGTAREGGGTCAQSCVQRAPEVFGITQRRAGTPRAGIHAGKPSHSSSCPAAPSSSSWAQLTNKILPLLYASCLLLQPASLQFPSDAACFSAAQTTSSSIAPPFQCNPPLSFPSITWNDKSHEE